MSEWEDASAALDQSADSLIKLGVPSALLILPPHPFILNRTSEKRKEK